MQPGGDLRPVDTGRGPAPPGRGTGQGHPQAARPPRAHRAVLGLPRHAGLPEAAAAVHGGQVRPVRRAGAGHQPGAGHRLLPQRPRLGPGRRGRRPRSRHPPDGARARRPAVLRGPGRRGHDRAPGARAPRGTAPLAPPGRPVHLRDRRGPQPRRRDHGRPAELRTAGVRGPPPVRPPVPVRLLLAGPVHRQHRRRRRDGAVAGRPRPDSGPGPGPAPAGARSVPDDGGRDRGPGRPPQPPFPAHLPRPGGLARAAPIPPGRGRGPVPDAVLQRAEELQPPADRGVPRAADLARQVDHRVALDPRHARLLRHGDLPGRDVRHLRRARFPARADRPAAGDAAAGGEDVRVTADLLRHQRDLDREQDRGPGPGPAGRHRPGRPELPSVPPLRPDAGRGDGRLPGRVPAEPLLDVRRGAAHRDQAPAADAAPGGQAGPGQDAPADQLHLRRDRLRRGPGDGGVPGDQARPGVLVGRGLVRLRPVPPGLPAAHGHAGGPDAGR